MARLEIRILDSEKEKLEKLARMLGVTVSDMMRGYVTKFAEIEKTIEIMETVKQMDMLLTEKIIESEPFQELLSKLRKYQDSCTARVGFHSEKMVTYEGIMCTDWRITEKDGRLAVQRVIWDEECNEYGTCWKSEYNPRYEDLSSITEIREFLDEMEFQIDTVLQEYIQDIKKSLGVEISNDT